MSSTVRAERPRRTPERHSRRELVERKEGRCIQGTEHCEASLHDTCSPACPRQPFRRRRSPQTVWECMFDTISSWKPYGKPWQCCDRYAGRCDYDHQPVLILFSSTFCTVHLTLFMVSNAAAATVRSGHQQLYKNMLSIKYDRKCMRMCAER